MNNKVCHLTSVHPEKDVRIFQKECISLLKAGFDVSLVVAGATDKIENGVKIYGVKKYNGKIARIIHSGKPILKKAIEIDADLYHLHDPELISVGIKLKKLGKKVIFDSHEDVPKQLLDKEWIPRPARKLTSFLYQHYEAVILKRFDALISVTPTLTKRLLQIHPTTVQITNYPIVNTDKIPDRKWGDSVCFAGGISPQWLHENIIEAIDTINGITYSLAGVPEESYLVQLKKMNGWKRVNYRGIIPYSQVADFIAESTAGIALNDYIANVGYKVGSLGNTKLFEYLMAGIPVIATDFELWKEIIEDNHCGICVNPHDTEALAKAILFLTQNKETAKKMGDAGREAVIKKYNWNSQAILLINLYRKLLNN